MSPGPDLGYCADDHFKLCPETSVEIEDIRQLGYLRIRIMPFKRNRKPPRCSNCQGSHTAGRCKNSPKCRNCDETHKTHDCPIKGITPTRNTIREVTQAHNTRNKIRINSNIKNTALTRTYTPPDKIFRFAKESQAKFNNLIWLTHVLAIP